MRNIKLVVEYDGTRYSGWQRQENAPSIQAEIEQSLLGILHEKIVIAGAGRTDAGVHARGQVANFKSPAAFDLFTLRGGLNGTLPDDIVIHSVDEVPLDFHARYSARKRTYSYTITTEPSALLRAFSWHVRYKLDPALLSRAADCLMGEHSFQSFCKMQSEVDHYRCTVYEAAWTREGSLLRFVVTADRFLHGMVRALTGTMVDLARGYISYDDFESLIGAGDRTEAGPAAPPAGLVLERVIY